MINNVTLVGRLTRDPELKFTPNGVASCSFTLAVNRTFSNQNGEKEADFINCVTWRKSAENLANYQRKGNQIGVIGRIQTRNYDGQDGKRVFVTEVVAESIQFLEARKENNNSGGGNSNARDAWNNSQNQRQQSQQQNQQRNNNFTRVDDDPFANNGRTIDISDDDLPF